MKGEKIATSLVDSAVVVRYESGFYIATVKNVYLSDGVPCYTVNIFQKCTDKGERVFEPLTLFKTLVEVVSGDVIMQAPRN